MNHVMDWTTVRRNLMCVLAMLLAMSWLSALAPAQTEGAQTQPAGQNQPEYVSLKTSHGEVVIELDPGHSPRSVANFLAYVDRNFYDGTIFHRVLAGSIIQGGGLTADMQAKPVEAAIENEWRNGLKHKRGSVAMARTTGDANSATSQFFINVIDNRTYDQPQADGAGYAVFGMVIAGMKVVDDIRFVPVSPQANHEAVPAKPVVIESVERISKEDALAKAEADKPKRRRPPQPLPERPPQPKPPPAPAPTPEAPTAPQPSSDEPPAHVLMTTSMGEIVIELDRARAPISCANFLSYVDKGFYSGTIFHRVIPTFMIQGGGFTSDMAQKPTDPPIANEWRNGLKNARGTIAMARLGGNPDSATSQFFINVVNNAMLDQPQRDGAAYAVFGRVLAGMQAVDAIRRVTTGNRGSHENVPIEPVLIERVNRLTPEQAQAKVEAEQAQAPREGQSPPPVQPPAGSATQPGE